MVNNGGVGISKKTQQVYLTKRCIEGSKSYVRIEGIPLHPMENSTFLWGKNSNFPKLQNEKIIKNTKDVDFLENNRHFMEN